MIQKLTTIFDFRDLVSDEHSFKIPAATPENIKTLMDKINELIEEVNDLKRKNEIQK